MFGHSVYQRVSFLTLVLFCLSAGAQQIVLRQTPLGPMPSDNRSLSVSPDGSRFAVAASAGSRQQVFVDGVASAMYSGLINVGTFGQGDVQHLLLFSPDGMHLAFAANKGPGEAVMVVDLKEGPVFDQIGYGRFSPVGHRFMYTATKGGQHFAVVDGQVSPGYKLVNPSESWFSDDGKHLGILVTGSDGKQRVILDGKEGPAFQGIQKVRVSHTGRVAYVVNASATDPNDTHMVIDGEVGPKFAVIYPAIFSDDGTHVAYFAQKLDRQANGGYPWVAVIDGKESPEYLKINRLILSPDGAHCCYTAMAANGRQSSTYAIVDGQKSPDYADVESALYSPDGKHLAYIATTTGATGGKFVVVRDGKEEDAWETIDNSSLKFSPDSQHFAYTVRQGSYGYAIIDGQKSPGYGAIEQRSLTWSPELGRFRYKIRGSTDVYSVAIGTEPLPKDAIPTQSIITPDGKHRVTVVPVKPESGQQGYNVMLDGKAVGESYSTVNQLQISNDGVHTAFLAGGSQNSQKKGQFVVFDGREGQPYFRINHVMLSRDGQHVAYDGAPDGTSCHLVVDTLEGPTYQQVPLGNTNACEAMQFRQDGSLSFLAVMDGKLNHMVYPPESLNALPKAKTGTAAPSTPGFAQIYTFGKVPKDGNKPALLAVAPDGTIYGATTGGGKYQHGVLFGVKPDGSDYTILHNFTGAQQDGNNPTSLAVGPDGAAYGTLMDRGSNGGGCIYRCATAESDFKIIHPFGGNDGASPIIQCIDRDGTIYGLVRGPDAIFRIKSDGSELKQIFVTHRSMKADEPTIGAFANGGDGYFYGVNQNAVYKLKTDGTGYAVVRKFEGTPVDINSTDRQPIVGADGMIYGYAVNGGPNNTGVVFRLKKDGSDYNLILSPEGDQLQPHAIADGPDNKLYVLAKPGIVQINRDGSDMKVLQKMDGGGFANTIAVHGGAIFGATYNGGTGGGVIFRYGLGGGGGTASSAEPTVTMQVVPPTAPGAMP
jgi:uncharacterized repeat protein (TIGR03803 family)